MNTYQVYGKNKVAQVESDRFFVDDNNNLCFAIGIENVAMVNYDEWQCVTKGKEDIDEVMKELAK